MISSKSIQRVAYGLDKLIKAENSIAEYWKLIGSDIWPECQKCMSEQKSNYAQLVRDRSRTTHLDPGITIKKTVTRNDLLRLVTAWVSGFQEYDSIWLEVMFSCLWCYKTLVRFDTLKSLDFCCLQMQDGDNDPDFLSIIVPASFEKNKSNPAYPSCTFRDQTPIQCSQFFLCLLILKTLDDRGNEMLFYNANISKKKW